MPEYYTYRKDVPLKPGQTLGFTPGKGYYAAEASGSRQPAKAAPEQVSDAASTGGYTTRPSDSQPVRTSDAPSGGPYATPSARQPAPISDDGSGGRPPTATRPDGPATGIVAVPTHGADTMSRVPLGATRVADGPPSEGQGGEPDHPPKPGNAAPLRTIRFAGPAYERTREALKKLAHQLGESENAVAALIYAAVGHGRPFETYTPATNLRTYSFVYAIPFDPGMSIIVSVVRGTKAFWSAAVLSDSDNRIHQADAQATEWARNHPGFTG